MRIFYRGGKTSRNACHSGSDPRLQLSRIGLTGGDIGISIYAGIFLKALITVVAATANQISGVTFLDGDVGISAHRADRCCVGVCISGLTAAG